MTDFDTVVSAIKSGALPDRLKAKARHAEHGTTSISSIVEIMREAADAITALTAEVEALKAQTAPRIKIDTNRGTRQKGSTKVWWCVLKPVFTAYQSGWGDTESDARAKAQAYIEKTSASNSLE